MAKRSITSPSSRRPAKKSREKKGGQKVSSAFDKLCDDALLRIASYADLRSLVRLTRCTHKSLRNRFDPGNENRSDQCCNLWRDVFEDLRMAPLDEEASETLDCVGAIGYRQSLCRRLVARVEETQKETEENTMRYWSLPLCHYRYKPLSRMFNQEEDNEFDPLSDPMYFGYFALFSSGTGEGYVIINPETSCMEIHDSILENTICLERSGPEGHTQESNDVDNEGVWTLQKSPMNAHSKVLPRQVLPSVAYGIDKPVRLEWEDYFGKDTPFATSNDDVRHTTPPELGISGVIIDVCDEIDEDGITLAEKQILMMREVRDQETETNLCTEIAMWADRADERKHDPAHSRVGSNFRLRKIWRIPESGHCFDICLKTKYLYMKYSDASYSTIPEDSRPPVEDLCRAVFRCPLGGRSVYPQPDCFFLASNEVSHLELVGTDILLVGTKRGTVEIWKEMDQSMPNVRRGGPRHLHTLHAENTFSGEDDLFSPNRILGIQALASASLRCGFVTVQSSVDSGTIISLWQARTLNFEEEFNVQNTDFEVMAKVEYRCLLPQIVFCGRQLLVLAYDDPTGRMYLDVYHVFSSRYGLSDFECTNAPLSSSIITHARPEGQHRIKLASRIDICHRVEIAHAGSTLGFPERLPLLNANHRFVTVVANDGLKASDGTRSPGIVVIDLDEHS